MNFSILVHDVFVKFKTEMFSCLQDMFSNFPTRVGYAQLHIGSRNYLSDYITQRYTICHATIELTKKYSLKIILIRSLLLDFQAFSGKQLCIVDLSIREKRKICWRPFIFTLIFVFLVFIRHRWRSTSSRILVIVRTIWTIATQLDSLKILKEEKSFTANNFFLFFFLVFPFYLL